MSYSLNLNTSVCTEIANSTLELCLKGVNSCESILPVSGALLTALEAALFVGGGVLLIKGVSHGVITIKLLSSDRNGTPRLMDYQSLRSEGGFWDAAEQPARYRNPRMSILKHLSSAVDYVARAAIPVVAGLITYGINKIDCPTIPDCRSIQAYANGGCVLGMKFFIQVIDNAFGPS